MPKKTQELIQAIMSREDLTAESAELVKEIELSLTEDLVSVQSNINELNEKYNNLEVKHIDLIKKIPAGVKLGEETKETQVITADEAYRKWKEESFK